MNPDYSRKYKELACSYSTLRELYIDYKSSADSVLDVESCYCPDLPSNFGLDIDKVAPVRQERDVYILSIINWDFRFQRPQHLAKNLANRSRVFYVEMELSPTGPHLHNPCKNVYTVRLPMSDVGVIDPYSGIASQKQISGWIEKFYQFVDEVAGSSHKTVLIQHPWWWQFAKHLAPEFQIVFDCMDDISGFSNTTDGIVALEQDMIEKCDKLVVSSAALFESTGKTKEPILVRNGCAVDHFSDISSENELELVEPDSNTLHANVGYVGALAEWFDIELLEQVVLRDSSLHYHICGSVTYEPILALDEFDNVHFYGEIPYSQVPGFIDRMDVMMIPFKLTPIIQACDPVKFYEHCILGIPTVATQMPELYRARHLCALSTGAEEFHSSILGMIERGKDKDFVDDLKEYAIENSWERRANHMWSKISQYPKVSVVLLNYGDPCWSLGAIHSLIENRGNYPNIEIILVDNGSTAEQLKELIQGVDRLSNHVEIQTILNKENVGFAKGNNIGIEACDGEYVVLLNNDTYVGPGAIFAMVKHLQDNEDVGVVGPLTNNIGNEAKLFVNYPDVKTMGYQAKRWLSGYRGEFSTLRVVAYFCVMFRAEDLQHFGLLNESYGRGMFEDDDHCNTIRSFGYEVVLAEDAFVHHHLSATFGEIKEDSKKSLFETNKRVYEERWGEWIPHKYREARPLSKLESLQDE